MLFNFDLTLYQKQLDKIALGKGKKYHGVV